MNIFKGKYIMKIWNSVKATSFNVDFMIPEEYKNIVGKEKVPFEFLECDKSFEEYVIAYDGGTNKFLVITTWADKQGNSHFKRSVNNNLNIWQ